MGRIHRSVMIGNRLNHRGREAPQSQKIGTDFRMTCAELFNFGLFDRNMIFFNPCNHLGHFFVAIGIKDQTADVAEHSGRGDGLTYRTRQFFIFGNQGGSNANQLAAIAKAQQIVGFAFGAVKAAENANEKCQGLKRFGADHPHGMGNGTYFLGDGEIGRVGQFQDFGGQRDVG